MANITLAFSVVFPLFCMMALGYGLRRAGVLNEGFLTQLNGLCFKVFLPLVLFLNVYQSNFKQDFSPWLLGFAALAMLACFAVLMWLVPLAVKQPERRGVLVQGVFRSNFILFGIPVTVSLFGAQEASVTAVLIAFIIPLFNVLSVLALAHFGYKKTSGKALLLEMAQNPLILAALAAFVFIFTGFRLPALVEGTLASLSQVATPLALMVLGGSFTFGRLRKSAWPLALGVVGKLVAVPLVFVSLAVLLGFRGGQLAALFALFASPTAVSTFTMAQSAGADGDLACGIVVLSSLFSILTIFLGITMLLAGGFL